MCEMPPAGLVVAWDV